MQCPKARDSDSKTRVSDSKARAYQPLLACRAREFRNAFLKLRNALITRGFLTVHSSSSGFLCFAHFGQLLLSFHQHSCSGGFHCFVHFGQHLLLLSFHQHCSSGGFLCCVQFVQHPLLLSFHQHFILVCHAQSLAATNRVTEQLIWLTVES